MICSLLHSGAAGGIRADGDVPSEAATAQYWEERAAVCWDGAGSQAEEWESDTDTSPILQKQHYIYSTPHCNCSADGIHTLKALTLILRFDYAICGVVLFCSFGLFLQRKPTTPVLCLLLSVHRLQALETASPPGNAQHRNQTIWAGCIWQAVTYGLHELDIYLPLTSH